MLASRIQELAPMLAGMEPSSKTGSEWRFGNRGSLRVHVTGAKRGKWKDYEGGDYGDALGLVAHLRSTDSKGAYRWALGWMGIAATSTPIPKARQPTPPSQPIRTVDRVALARRVWQEATDAAGTPVEAYLASRGLSLPVDAPLAFHPACPRGQERHPAMLALMTDPVTGEACGVHRTFLTAEGRKAEGSAKMMLGDAGVVRLVLDEEVTLGLGIAEGIETSLSVMQAYGWRPVWAAATAVGIKTFPVLAGIESLTVFADTDWKHAGMNAAMECCARWSEAGREAKIVAPPDGDWNDAHTGGLAHG